MGGQHVAIYTCRYMRALCHASDAAAVDKSIFLDHHELGMTHYQLGMTAPFGVLWQICRLLVQYGNIL